MGLKSVTLALLFAGLGSAYLDDKTTRTLMGSGLRVNQWIGMNEGIISSGTSHRHGGKTPFPGVPVPPGTMTDDPPNDSPSGFKAYCFEQKLSHFDSSVNGTFCQRYWIAAPNYKPGGPIYVADAGEGAGDALATDSTLHYAMAKKYNGIMITLEHRYYGWSIPVDEFTTDGLRFLNNKEALEDSAYFIAHWQPKAGAIPGLVDPKSITPPRTPWIYYSGSYPGARAAHMRALYPDLVYGAIASSAVVAAKTHYPEYFDAVHKYGDQKCVGALTEAMTIIDATLDLGGSAATELKTMFSCEELTDVEFVTLLRDPLFSWQLRFWWSNDQDVYFIGKFCPLILETAQATTIDNGKIAIPPALVNWAKYVKVNYKDECLSSMKDCYGVQDDFYYNSKTDIWQSWRLWTWQVCTEWGYQMCGYSDGRASMISKRVSYESLHYVCKQAFPPGDLYSIPEQPNIDSVNSIGGYELARDRLAFIDGEGDPWREATIHSANFAKPRVSTDTRPNYLIPHGGHCYDLYQDTVEPKYMEDTHKFIYNFMDKWLDEWKASQP